MAVLDDVWEIRRAVEELPEDEREVIRMGHFEELTHREIAERLGIAVGTVKSRSFRAHKRLATRLGHLRSEREVVRDVRELNLALVAALSAPRLLDGVVAHAKDHMPPHASGPAPP